MPILNRNDAREVERLIARVFDADESRRAALLRRLFAEVMDFEPRTGDVSLAGAPESVSLPRSAERVAELGGVGVFYAALDAPGRVRRAEAVAIANEIERALGEDMLIAIANKGASALHFIHPQFGGAASAPVLRRMVIERGAPMRTAVQQLSNIYWQIQDKDGDVRAAVESAFDVEPVTRLFFSEYNGVFDFAENEIRRAAGESDGDDDSDDVRENRRAFAQTLFNRLTFVYFLSRKGWLRFGGDADYLRALWRDYQNAGGEGEDKNFHYDRLRPLFFGGLNNYLSADIGDEPAKRALIGDVPFLNGGLFEYAELDERYKNSVPDSVFERALTGLFERFNFTVTESTPFDVEVAVDPEMLGKMFEELVTGRHESGAYYTPRAVVSFMCREGLKGFLRRRVPDLDGAALARFVDGRDASGFDLTASARIAQAIDEVSVVDPACGSGAYLLGMMQELVELRAAVFPGARQDAPSVYDLKLHVIERNLYGADKDPVAANIAMLRLWLSLAVDYEGETPKPLPNLDFKIAVGDTLAAPDPSAAAQDDMSIALVRNSRIGELKGDYMRESDGARKAALRRGIFRAESALRQALGDAAAPDGAVDWRVNFAEAFANGGFDIAVANPPYVRQELIAGKDALSKLYAAAATKRSDLYCYFYARALQLLADGGTHVFVCSNSWLDVGYGAKLQEYLLNNARVRTVYESAVERQFSTADINTIISVIEKSAPNDADETRFVSLRDEFESAIADAGGSMRREVVKTRGELREAGMGAPNARGVRKFVGDKWGGKYLRAPDIYHHILRTRSDKLVRLGDAATVRFGIKTGANKFFYLNEEDRERRGIEPEFLRAAMTTPRESRRIAVDADSLPNRLFMCHKDKRELRGTNALAYIEWGESQGYHLGRSVRSRRRWWDLGEWAGVRLGMSYMIDSTVRAFVSDKPRLFGDNFQIINSKSAPINKIWASLNSAVSQLMIHVVGRVNFGGGLVKIQTYEVEGLNLVNPAHLSGIDEAIFSEIACDVLNPSAARRALDDAVFDALGLTRDERDAVYEAVRELVENRRRRAESV